MYIVLRAERLMYLANIIPWLVACVLCVSRKEPLVYLTKIIQGLVPIVSCVLEAELLVYLTKIIRGLVAYCVLCVRSTSIERVWECIWRRKNGSEAENKGCGG